MLAGFAEEPADSFVDQVVGMVKEDVGDSESIVELAVADEGHGADDADALLPKGLSIAGKIIQQISVLIEQPLPQQRITGKIDQIPIVDIRRMRKIKVDTILL